LTARWLPSPAADRESAQPSADGWEEEATVAALDRSVDRAQEVVGDLARAAAIEVEVSDSDWVEEALSKVEADLGPLAIMVNNAGALAMSEVARINPLIEQPAEQAVGPITTPLEALARLTNEGWRFVLSAHISMARSTARGPRAVGWPSAVAGAIVNMASVCGIEGCTGHPHYSGAKAGVPGLPGLPRRR